MLEENKSQTYTVPKMKLNQKIYQVERKKKNIIRYQVILAKRKW